MMNKRLYITADKWRYMMIDKSVVVLLFLVAAIHLSAQNTLSLSQAVEKGLENNFDILISRIETQMAANKLNNAQKERLPIVRLFAGQGNDFVNDRSPTSFINGFYRDRNLIFGVDGEWILYDGFQGRLNKNRYKKLKDLKDGEEQISIENTIFSILSAYYNALLQKEAVAVARESLNLSIEQFRDAKLQEQLGTASAYDVTRFENATLIDSINIVQKKKELDAALVNLNQVMGNKKMVTYLLSDPLSYTPQVYNLSKLKSQVERTNKALINRYKQQEVLQFNTEATRKASLPQVSVNTGISQRFNGTVFPEIDRIKSNTFQYNLRFSARYNLFDGGNNKRAVEENELLEQIGYAQTEQAKNNLADELTRSVVNYNRQLELILVNERLIESTKNSIVLEKERFANGYSSALNYRTVQLDYINAQFRKLESIYELLINELEVLQLTGKLTSRNF